MYAIFGKKVFLRKKLLKIKIKKMKKYYTQIYLTICHIYHLYDQSGQIDPYNFGIVSSQNVGFVPIYKNASMQIVYNSLLPSGPGSYIGEYMIGLRKHPTNIPGI